MTENIHRANNFIILAGGAALIGFAPIFVRWSEMSPSWVTFYRMLLAIPFLILINIYLNKAIVFKIKSKRSINTKNESLTFTQQHRLQSLPNEIRKTEKEIKKLTELLSDMDLFERDKEKFLILSDGLVQRQRNLAILEDEWLILEEKNSEV